MIKSKQKIKEELFDLAFGKVDFWYRTGRFFYTYHGSHGSSLNDKSISFEISQNWLGHTRMEVRWAVPTDDDWSPTRWVKEVFMFNNASLYNTIHERYEEKKEAERKREEEKRQAYLLVEEKLKAETLSALLENAKTTDDINNN